MPLTVITAVEASAAMAGVAANLRYIMDDVGVRLPVQEVLFHHGFTTMARFVGMEDSKIELRKAFTQVMGLTATDGVQPRCDVADLLNAWDMTKARVESETKMRAEISVNETTQPASNQDLKTMLKAHERIHGELESRLTPGRYLLGTKLEEVQANEPEVERLKDVTCRDDGDEETLTTEVGKDGRLVVKKGCKTTTHDPQNPEDLRTRYRVLGHAWEFAGLKHPGRAWLLGFGTTTYAALADYLLGPKVLGLRVLRDPVNPNSEVKPAWITIMNYEYQIRKAAFEQVRRGGITAVAALSAAMKDQELRGLHFTSIFQIQATSSGRKQDNGSGKDNGGGNGKNNLNSNPNNPKRTNDANVKKDKGSNKALNRGNNYGKKKGLAMKTPDGRRICFAYQRPGNSCDGSCGMVHCCQSCFLSHKNGAAECKKKA
jgi:hypothetical protein